MSDQAEPTISVSVSMKVNLGNYESADAFISVSGLPAGATAEQIEELLDTGKLAWSLMTRRLGDKVAEIKAKHIQELQERYQGGG